jgi:hypothetical protein
MVSEVEPSRRFPDRRDKKRSCDQAGFDQLGALELADLSIFESG